MEMERSGGPFIVAQDSTGAPVLRQGSRAGARPADDPHLRRQLELIRGCRLSQFGMTSTGSIQLAFWGEGADGIARQIVIERATLELSRAGRAATTHSWNDDIVATSLLSTLDHLVVSIDLALGFLTVDFDNGLQLRVAPDERYEAWQISSEDQLLIVCTPGGDLTSWYPDASPDGIPSRG